MQRLHAEPFTGHSFGAVCRDYDISAAMRAPTAAASASKAACIAAFHAHGESLRVQHVISNCCSLVESDINHSGP